MEAEKEAAEDTKKLSSFTVRQRLLSGVFFVAVLQLVLVAAWRCFKLRHYLVAGVWGHMELKRMDTIDTTEALTNDLASPDVGVVPA